MIRAVPLPVARSFPRVVPSADSLATLVVLLIPLLFLGWSWRASGGFPYSLDSNETYLSYVHALNMVQYDPRSFSFLTTGADIVLGVPPEKMYTHNANFPRYVHYALFGVGVTTMQAQTLVIAAFGTLLSTALMLATFRGGGRAASPLWIVAPLLFAIDVLGFLGYTVNTYRTFSFVLFWACASAIVLRARPPVVALTFFFVFHFEYAFALFLSTTTVLLLALTRPARWWRTLLAMGVGATLSLGVLLVQLVTFYGVDGLIRDFLDTVSVRIAGANAAEPISSMDALIHTLATTADLYGPASLAALAWALVSSPAFLLLRARRANRGGDSSRAADAALDVRALVARLSVATLAATLVTMLLMHRYFLAAYVENYLPLLVFPVMLAFASVALDLAFAARWLAARVGVSGRLPAALACTAVAAIVLHNSRATLERFPLLRPEYLRVLETELAGKAVVAPLYYAHLAHALTSGIASEAPVAIAVEDIDYFRRVVRAPEEMYHFCIKRPWFNVDCDAGMELMLADGHRLRYGGPGADYVVMEIVTPPSGTPPVVSAAKGGPGVLAWLAAGRPRLPGDEPAPAASPAQSETSGKQAKPPKKQRDRTPKP